MKVLLTGATGFLGSHLARRLVRDGHQVLATVRPASSTARLAGVVDRVEWVPAATADWGPVLDGVDAVVHAATAYGRATGAELEVFEANVAFPVRILAACLDRGARFLNTDTFQLEFADPSSARPHTRTRYLPSYVRSKRQLFEWGDAMAAARDGTFATLRLEHLYGPQDRPDKFVSLAFDVLTGGQASWDLTSGEQERDFVFVDDVVDAYLRVLDADLAPGAPVFRVGTGRSVSIRAFVERLHAFLGARTDLRFGARPQRPGEIPASRADTTALRALGWSPGVDLEAGFAEMVRRGPVHR